MVLDEDVARGRRVLRQAVPEAMPSDPEAKARETPCPPTMGMPMDFSGGRLTSRQPAGIPLRLDAVMLAAAVPARPGQAALELGAGAGRRACAWRRGCRMSPSPGSRSIAELAALAGAMPRSTAWRRG